MDKHIERALVKLKREMLGLGALVEEGIFRAYKAYESRSSSLAEEVVGADQVIDEKEVEIEEECLKVLALYQPTGQDLRMVVALMKMTNDLERIGDCAVNIAWQAHSLSFVPPVDSPPNVGELAAKTKDVLRRALECFVNLDVEAAWSVLASDDEIDAMHRENGEWVRGRIEEIPRSTEALLNHLSVSKNLERVADHVTNLAEDVIYMVKGDIVRHGKRRAPQ